MCFKYSHVHAVDLNVYLCLVVAIYARDFVQVLVMVVAWAIPANWQLLETLRLRTGCYLDAIECSLVRGNAQSLDLAVDSMVTTASNFRLVIGVCAIRAAMSC